MLLRRTTVRLILMLVLGVGVTIVTAALGEWVYAPTVGWCVASLFYSTSVWLTIGRMNADQTQEHASQEEPARGIADLLVILLSVASLFSIVFVLVQAASSQGIEKGLLASLAVASVALSWVLLHTLYTLRYARIFYRTNSGVNFNQDDPPQYTDFAYLAFTLGMTYQVSDTNISTKEFRIVILRHVLLSFVFGSVILATTINLIAGLSK